ncbi:MULTISPECIES: hypothetical protein [Vibrio]|uniref:hypothetical protein n=1 Tax=Vibrio TaxID=662 RepID=UPI000698EBB6|nr:MULTISPECIES: hypothetical protein [Vibrio]
MFRAEVPFFRPEAFSNDYVIAPFIAIEDIQLVHQMLLKDTAADYYFSVCEFSFLIQRGLKLVSGNCPEMFSSTTIALLY